MVGVQGGRKHALLSILRMQDCILDVCEKAVIQISAPQVAAGMNFSLMRRILEGMAKRLLASLGRKVKRMALSLCRIFFRWVFQESDW